MRIKRAIAVVVVAACSSAGLVACGDDDDSGSAGTTSSSADAAGSGSAGSSGSAAGKVDPSKPKVRIVSVAPKVPTGDTYTPTLVGAQAAAAQINAEGGFGGREVVIDDCNTQNSPQIAATCARKEVGKDPVAMVGCDLNWPAAGFPVFAKAKIPSVQCLTTPEDAKNPYSISLDPGGLGQYVAIGRWLCKKPEVKTIVNQLLDLPQMRSNYVKSLTPIIEGCGKKISYVFVPLTSADYTPYLQKILSQKPDFVLAFALNGPLAVQIFKSFQQNGFPADKMFTVSSVFDVKTGLGPAGASADGVYGVLPTASADDTSNPDVPRYLAAMKMVDLQGVDIRNPTSQTSYMQVNAIYTAAKATGFDEFNGEALQKWANTATGVKLPLSRELVNPGPASSPQSKQVFGQLVQWKNGKMNVVMDGTENGWLDGGA